MLKTETRNVKTMHIDKMSNMEMLQIINEENMNSVKAVGTALNEISEGIDLIVDSINKGGKIYVKGKENLCRKRNL